MFGKKAPKPEKSGQPKELSQQDVMVLKEVKAQEKIQAFKDDYMAVRAKHGLDFYAVLVPGPSSIEAQIIVMTKPEEGQGPRKVIDTIEL